MNKKERVRMAIIAITLILIAIITIIMIVLMKNGGIHIFEKDEEIYISKRLIEEQDWDTDVVSNITTENVPIPTKYNYVSGNIETGTIIEDDMGGKYLWIPYSKNIETTGTSEYYKEVSDYYEMESDEKASLEKYNGFYVSLNMSVGMEDLKTINNEDYVNYAESMNYETDTNLQKHILSKEEIEQIENYTSNSKFFIGENTIGIEATIFSVYSNISITARIYTTKKDNKSEKEETNNIKNNTSIIGQEDNNKANVNANTNISASANQEAMVENTENNNNEDIIIGEYTTYTDTIYMLKTDNYPNGVPIPKGYKKAVNNGIVTIQDSNNKNLIYIWVPLSSEELKTRKNELQSLYKNYRTVDGEQLKFDENSEIYKGFNNTTEELPEDFVKSIEKYGGFYVSEAELGFDSSNNFYNKARGMVGSTVTLTKNGGNYYKSDTIKDFSYDTIKKIAQSVTEDNSSVVSHLMYGVEYDAIVLWINKTNSTYQDEKGQSIIRILLENSTYVGKYSNSGRNSTSSAENSAAYFNKIWGLGGNLSEITQERAGNSYVIRGGSWNDTGEDFPIAGRKITDNISSEAIGFRTCLYVNPYLNETTEEAESYTPEVEDDTEFYDGDLDYPFEIWKESTRFINSWDGVNIYRTPDLNTEIIGTLGYSNAINITAKAKENFTNNGKETCWLQIKTADSSYAYVNTLDYTDETKLIGNHKFIMKGKTTRYHKNNLVVYNAPDENSGKLTTIDDVGTIDVIGKSIDLEWAAVKVDEKTGYVKSSDLRLNMNIEKVGVYSFYIGDNIQRIVSNKSGTYLYKKPGDEYASEIVRCGEMLTIEAMTADGKIARTKYNGDVYYVLTSDLSMPGPSIEISNIDKTTGKVTIKVRNLGRGVKAVYSNGKTLEGKWDDEYYVVVLQAYKNETYKITAIDNEGNETIYGNVDTSKIQIEDPSKKPVEPTTPTQPSIGNTENGNTSTDKNNTDNNNTSTDKNNTDKNNTSTDNNNTSTDKNNTDKNNTSTDKNNTDKNNTSTDKNNTEKNNTSTDKNNTEKNNTSTDKNNAEKNNTSTDKNNTDKNNTSTDKNNIDKNNTSTDNNDDYDIEVDNTGSTGETSSKDTEAPVARALYYTYDNKNFTWIKDGDTIKATKKFYLWIQVEDNMVSGKNLYAYKTSAKRNDRISGAISSSEGSGDYKGYYYIIDTISANGTYYYQLCDGSADSPYSYVSVKVKNIPSSSDNKPKITNIQVNGKKVIVTASKDTQYINYREYGANSEKYVAASSSGKTTLNLRNNTTYMIWAGKFDENNNALYSDKEKVTTGSATSESPSNKDTEAPEITLCTASTSIWTNKNVTITMQATDNVKVESFYVYSPITKTEQKISAKKTNNNYYYSTTTISKEGQGYYIVYAKDSSGNCSNKRGTWISIDKTAPTFDFSYHTKNTTTTKQKVKCDDGLSGIEKCIKVQSKSGNNWTNGSIYSAYEWYNNVFTKYKVTIYDKVGNSKQVYISNKKASYTESGL